MEMELERARIARISSLSYWQGQSRKASRIVFGVLSLTKGQYHYESTQYDVLAYGQIQYCTPIANNQFISIVFDQRSIPIRINPICQSVNTKHVNTNLRGL